MKHAGNAPSAERSRQLTGHTRGFVEDVTVPPRRWFGHLCGLRRANGKRGARRRGRVRTFLGLLATLWVGLFPSSAAADIPGPSHDYAIVREGDPELPDHTILRPADLNAVDFPMPIVVWGNGGCRDSNEEFHYFLTHFAAYGYFVIADGPPQNPYNPGELTGLVHPQPQKLIAGIDWALRQNANPASSYYGRLDPRRIAVMGQSCGGWETSDASSDPRVTSSIVWDSGFDPYNPADSMSLHAPVLYAYGGTGDYLNWDAQGGYAETNAPTVLASNANAGHTGMWDNPTPPAQPPGPYQNEPLVIAPEWLDFTLYGLPSARAYFLGANCGLCRRQGWTVQSKNWGGFTALGSPIEPTSNRPARACLPAAGRLKGAVLGPVALGMTRTAVREKLHRAAVVGAGFDDFCLQSGPGIRVGYPSLGLLGSLSQRERAEFRGRIVIALTANRYYALDGLRPGMPEAAAEPRPLRGDSYRVGVNRWYVLPGRAANGVLKVRHGIVQEIGIATKRLTTGGYATKRFLNSFA